MKVEQIVCIYIAEWQVSLMHCPVKKLICFMISSIGCVLIATLPRIIVFIVSGSTLVFMQACTPKTFVIVMYSFVYVLKLINVCDQHILFCICFEMDLSLCSHNMYVQYLSL